MILLLFGAVLLLVEWKLAAENGTDPKLICPGCPPNIPMLGGKISAVDLEWKSNNIIFEVFD